MARLSGQSLDLNVEDPGSNPRLRLPNEFVLSDPRGKFTMLCTNWYLLPISSAGILNWERGGFSHDTEKPL